MSASWEKTPELQADERRGLRWWTCLCGRRLSEHPFVNTDGHRWITCALRDSGRFESETRRVQYTLGAGVTVRPGVTPEPILG